MLKIIFRPKLKMFCKDLQDCRQSPNVIFWSPDNSRLASLPYGHSSACVWFSFFASAILRCGHFAFEELYTCIFFSHGIVPPLFRYRNARRVAFHHSSVFRIWFCLASANLLISLFRPYRD